MEENVQYGADKDTNYVRWVIQNLEEEIQVLSFSGCIEQVRILEWELSKMKQLHDFLRYSGN